MQERGALFCRSVLDCQPEADIHQQRAEEFADVQPVAQAGVQRAWLRRGRTVGLVVQKPLARRVLGRRRLWL